jgi:hypothetical protein
LNEFQVSVGDGNLAPEINPVHSVKPNQARRRIAQNKKKDKSLLKISNSL